MISGFDFVYVIGLDMFPEFDVIFHSLSHLSLFSLLPTPLKTQFFLFLFLSLCLWNLQLTKLSGFPN